MNESSQVSQATSHQPESRHALVFWSGIVAVLLMLGTAVSSTYYLLLGMSPQPDLDQKAVSTRQAMFAGKGEHTAGDKTSMRLKPLFPAPGVEPNQRYRREVLEREAAKQLERWHWTNAERRTATIPVQRAMQLMTPKELNGISLGSPLLRSREAVTAPRQRSVSPVDRDSRPKQPVEAPRSVRIGTSRNNPLLIDPVASNRSLTNNSLGMTVPKGAAVHE